MIQVSISIYPTSAPAGSADAMVIWSPDPQIWLEEMSRWKVPLKDVRIYVLPRSRADLTAVGVLVVLLKSVAIGAASRGLPYRCIAGTLFIPSQSALFPPMSDDEVLATFLHEVSVLTPTGLVGFSKANALTVASLLAPPAAKQADFNRAVAGNPPAMRLTEIYPLRPPTVQSILEEGRDDIGTEPPADLPKSSEESVAGAAIASVAAAPLLLLGLPFGLLRNVFGTKGKPPERDGDPNAKRSLMRKFLDLFKSKSKRGSAPINVSQKPLTPPAPNQSPLAHSISILNDLLKSGGMSNRLLAATLGRLSAALEARRNRELHRLMKMLQESPDEGLRHAIPFSPGDTHRGTAAPGDRLTTRQVDFSLTGINYGGPGDAWNIGEDFRAKLQKRYRELANRELHLGRFRRAAYIFAHLLGDFPAASGALKQGRHFREAAALYREKLFNMPAAAECLEEAGLLLEAIPIYKDLKKFEKVGDLYTKLERTEDAAAAYELEIARLLEQSDSLAASMIAEMKLASVDRALLILDEAWPSRRQAAECLRKSFKMRGNLGRHDQTTKRITKIAGESSHEPPTLAAILVELALAYPDAAVRRLSDDSARVTVGRYLREGGHDNSALIRSLTALSPADKTLARDGRRYLRIGEPAPQRTSDGGKSPQLVREFKLSTSDLTFVAAASTGDDIIAMARGSDRSFLASANWAGSALMRWIPSATKPNARVELLPILKSGGPTQCICWDITGRTFVEGGSFAITKGTSIEMIKPWGVIAEKCIALCHEGTGLIWTIEDIDTLTLLSWDAASNTVRSSHSLDLWLGTALRSLSEQPTHLPMAAHQGHIFIGIGSQVAHIRNMSSVQFIDMPGKVNQLVPLQSMGRFRVVALCENGVRLIFWPDAECVSVTPALPVATAGFTRAGTLVIVSRNGAGFVYATQGATILSKTEFYLPSGAFPLAILPTNAQNEFAVVTTSGQVIIYKVPG